MAADYFARLPRAALPAVIAFLLAACGAAPEPPVRVTVNPWVGYDPLVLAREGGLLDEERVKVVELTSNSDSQRALRNGLAEAAALTLDESLRLADAGVPLKIVALLSDSYGADAVLARPDITTPAQVKGKRIALEETALGVLVLDRLLAAGGLGRDDVTTLHAEAAMHPAVLASGKADVVITFEPMKNQLQNQGFRVIFDSRQMPGEIVDVLVARADLAPERIAALRAAWDTGRQAMLADTASAATLLAPGVDLTPEQYLATLQGLRFLTPEENAARLDASALAKSSAALVGHLQRAGLLSRPPDWQALVPAGSAP